MSKEIYYLLNLYHITFVKYVTRVTLKLTNSIENLSIPHDKIYFLT